ncbi:complement component C7-like isoform X2 [Cynoglossus semilaevis]|uniref:complement component C7-like isoform X2 n=1 Tax=Cynoglossus semilaevis TaxID=244447 RepID=UPI000496E5B2|nr:complement component C7-like isoform X2 [Cynoglossus semilaevis]
MDPAAVLCYLALFFISAATVWSQPPVNCRWGSYGAWSECDGCSNTKVRTRHVAVHAQFGGTPCSGEATQTQACVSQKRCPLNTGCGERFRCTTGQCISQSLVCNGDQDCEDGLDERNCAPEDRQNICDIDKTPPNSELTGRGYDVLTGKLRAGVINTLSFGGQCRKTFSGDHKVYYRLPHNVLRYNFEVTVDNEETDESYESSWSYMQHIQSNALFGHDRRTFHKEVAENKAYKLLILKNKVELAQFQNSAPQYLTLSEGFWRALSSLPLTYDYSAYRQLLQMYGTHYMSEGSLGGEYQALIELDRQDFSSTQTTDIEYQKCWRKVKRRFFRKKVKITCVRLFENKAAKDGHSVNKMPIKVKIFGGDPSFISPLSVLDLENPEVNGEIYDNWASSVKDFPEIINHKLRPLYELVKEVECSGLKKLHLKRATEEYLSEEHPCHCRPCMNNAQPLLTGSECSCSCRPGTSGKACGVGTETGQQPGVIHGSWSCWSSWGSCSGGQRLRTRNCNNPAPSRGGRHCVGPEVENKPCEEFGIQHLQMMEPQCFGVTLPPPKTCNSPPNLWNAFILDPRDFYLVGTTVHYSCIDGFYLVGNSMARCAENQKWAKGAMLCKRSTCDSPQISGDVIGTPTKPAYEIGDRMTLSCPEGSVLEGEVSEIICSPSLQWSPSPVEALCRKVLVIAPPPPSLQKCKLWEKMGKSECVCLMPPQCPPSLQLCVRLGPSHRLLGVCQLGALRCMGRDFSLSADSECKWSEEFSSCADCQPGTVCSESERKCVCQDPSACPSDSAPLCVNTGDGSVATTMSECEVGARRCRGEHVTVIDIDACSP